MATESLKVRDPESWQRITDAACAQCAADLDRAIHTPLELGQPIAWATTAIVGKATNGLSSVHRVGVPKGNVAYTTCDIPIPDPKLWLTLSPALCESLAPCGFCEANWADHRRGMAA